MKIFHLLPVTIALLILPVKFASPLKAQTIPARPQMPQVEWRPFCAAEGQFAIDMPGNPKINVETFSTQITTYTYRSILKNKENTETYLLRHFDLDDLRLSNSNISITLNSAVDFFVVGANAKLLQVRDISLDGYPGKEFEFQPLSPKEPMGIGQVFLVDRRIYGLIVSTPKPENAQKFFDSFQLF
ncbi:MAG: hypothetical protein ACRC62_39820 [Microcoleus sp.]